MIERDWHGAYKESWKGVIVDDAFAHPAKFSRGLIRRIYEHAFEQGWLAAGDTALDPFGGVALGALEAMRRGLHWVGVELEPRFVDLGQQNIALWNDTYADALPSWGTALLSQGDSRELARVVGEAGCCVSSPPYASAQAHPSIGTVNKDGASPAARGDSQDVSGRKIDIRNSGDVRCESLHDTEKNQESRENAHRFRGAIPGTPNRQGDSPALLGREKATPRDGGGADSENIRPESLGLEGRQGTESISGKDKEGGVRSVPIEGESSDPSQGLRSLQQQPGQPASAMCELPPEATQASLLGRDQGGRRAAKEQWANRVGAVVTSPPWEQSVGAGGDQLQYIGLLPNENRRGKLGTGGLEHYNRSNPDNIGNESGPTFWLAARAIVAQTYQVLRPGAVAIWVTKAFVRNKARVDFPGQWLQLCQSCGFEPLEWVRAWLVEDNGTQGAMFGEDVRLVKERKSFFRRLAEKKGSPPIDYEVVVIVRKPLFAAAGAEGQGVEEGEVGR